MSDNSATTPEPEAAPTPETGAPSGAAPSMEDSWREVGKQFETLGQGIAQAFRAATNTDQAVEMKNGLEAMLRDIGKAVQDAAATPEGQKLREDTNRTVESLRVAGEQTVREARPQVITALKQLNEELQKLVKKLEGE